MELGAAPAADNVSSSSPHFMLILILSELALKSSALLFTRWAALFLAHDYLDTLRQAARDYLSIIELLYNQERLPLRV